MIKAREIYLICSLENTLKLTPKKKNGLLERNYINGCGALKSLPMSNCKCLEYATIESCSSLMFISKRQLPPTLKSLVINDCKNLQFLIDEGEASSL